MELGKLCQTLVIKMRVFVDYSNPGRPEYEADINYSVITFYLVSSVFPLLNVHGCFLQR